MRKLFLTIILILTVLFLLPGCAEREIAVSIFCEQNGWSPAMSSQPGIPLQAIINPDSRDQDLKYHWIAEQGTFMSWQDGEIEVLGSDIITGEQKVYWSLDWTDTIEEYKSVSFSIFLRVEENGSSKTVAEASAQIVEKDGLFSFK